jgi:hypothetical protein
VQCRGEGRRRLIRASCPRAEERWGGNAGGGAGGGWGDEAAPAVQRGGGWGDEAAPAVQRGGGWRDIYVRTEEFMSDGVILVRQLLNDFLIHGESLFISTTNCSNY